MNIEQEVREMLSSKIRNAPGMEEPPRPVLRRARTRRILNATGMAGIVAIVAAGSVVGVRSLMATPIEPMTRTPVPWASISTESSCLSSDIDFAINTARSELTLRPKVAGMFCLINRGATVRLFDQSGKPLNVPVVFGPAFGHTVLNDPTQATVIGFEWANGCAPQERTRFDLTLPQARITISALSEKKVNPCPAGGAVTGLTLTRVFGFPRLERANPFPTDLLELTISGVPKTVAPGEAIRFVVMLTNTRKSSVSLRPCPAYSMELRGAQTFAFAWQLNCTDAPSAIPPRSSLSFDMQVDVPSEATPGPATLTWEFAGGAAPGVQRSLMITAAG